MPFAEPLPAKQCWRRPSHDDSSNGFATPQQARFPEREIEVLREVAAGHTNAEIADRLHISQATVKTHLLHVYDKLGVTDRAAAVAHAYESNILTPRNS